MPNTQEPTYAAPYSSTLKRRGQDAVETPQVVHAPRKMMLLKPKRVANTAPNLANSSMLVFPTDSLGVTSELKSALLRAASRVGKDPATLELIKAVLSIGIQHVEARHAQNLTQGGLKRRSESMLEVDQERVKTAVTPPDTYGQVLYEDMLAALSAAGVKLKSRKKADVMLAYNELTAYEQEAEDDEQDVEEYTDDDFDADFDDGGQEDDNEGDQ